MATILSHLSTVSRETDQTYRELSAFIQLVDHSMYKSISSRIAPLSREQTSLSRLLHHEIFTLRGTEHQRRAYVWEYPSQLQSHIVLQSFITVLHGMPSRHAMCWRRDVSSRVLVVQVVHAETLDTDQPQLRQICRSPISAVCRSQNF